MNVVFYSFNFRYLLKNEDQYILDVNSGRGFVGFTISISLSKDQKAAYFEHGNSYIEELAEHVHQHQDMYLECQIDQDSKKKIHSTILKWQKENNVNAIKPP